MREIKFRAWDKNTKIMIHWDDLVKSRISFRNFRWALLSENSENFELMQYTGIEDKNGYEIYEGDIVNCYAEGLSEVVFRRGCFGLVTDGYFEAFENVMGFCEIVGNRYERIKLLEAEK
ncbi:YopX family protein [Trichococcus collinsii]|uniref:Phage uncharacterized protein TIGR01671 n=1 Tax=Trichococcus collinsii TaxID=157076 RepID=A0AB38A3Y3_9LACT|nr:YopX family protein [Trichococcus collinsii]CZR10927.1 yopx protein [Trichococcus collinsii]SEA96001.1 phage uncharacterized protein TIGR01671 [Trichococcus collinsii]